MRMLLQLLSIGKGATLPQHFAALKAALLSTLYALILALLFTGLLVLLARERDWQSALILASALCLLLIPLPSYLFSLRLAHQQQQIQQLTQVAREDHLTGVFNRAHLMSMLERELALSHRHNYPVSVLLMEISDFNHLQDEHGRDTGEQLLRDFASRIKDKTRESDLFGRFDGAQFLLVLPHTSYDDANRMAQGMLALGSSLSLHSAQGLVSVIPHIGVASTENSGRQSAPLLNEADYSLYQHRKEHGAAI